MSVFTRIKPWRQHRCLAKEHLPKETLLAFYDNDIAYCHDAETGKRIETSTVSLDYLNLQVANGNWIPTYSNKTRNFFEQMDDDKWSIVSWDNLRNEVCVRVLMAADPTASGTNQNYRMVTVNLPNMENYGP